MNAATLAGLDPDVHRLLQLPDRVLEVRSPSAWTTGMSRCSWLADHHNTGAGPAKGGSASTPTPRGKKSPRWQPT